MSIICSGLKRVAGACWKAVSWIDQRTTQIGPSVYDMVVAARSGNWSEAGHNLLRFTKGTATLGMGAMAVTSNAPVIPLIAAVGLFYGGNFWFTASDAWYSRKISRLGQREAKAFIENNDTVLSRIFNPKVFGKLQQYFFNGSPEIQTKLRSLLKRQEASSYLFLAFYTIFAGLVSTDLAGIPLVEGGEQIKILGPVVLNAALRAIRSRWCSSQLKEIRTQYEQRLPPREPSGVIELSEVRVTSPSGEDSSRPRLEEEDSSSEGGSGSRASSPVRFQSVRRTLSSQSLPARPSVVEQPSLSRLARVSEEDRTNLFLIARLYALGDLHSSQ